MTTQTTRGGFWRQADRAAHHLFGWLTLAGAVAVPLYGIPSLIVTHSPRGMLYAAFLTYMFFCCFSVTSGDDK